MLQGFLGGGFYLQKPSFPPFAKILPKTPPQITSRDSNVQKNFSEGIAVTGAITGTGAATIGGDTTVGGGTLNVTTSNSATSTLVVGCIEFYATSTATALRFLASTTPRAMVYEYGACPRL